MLNLFSLRDLLSSYNKAYVKERPIKSDFESFLNNLADYKNNLNTAHNKSESEEYIKGCFTDFIKKCLGSGDNIQVNTLEWADLAIYKDNIPQVLFEFKRPSNISEMITLNDFNRKALHEAIAYFYEQKMQRNFKIKHVIITNGDDFFFFDSRTFGHKKLEQLYYDFNEDILSIDNKQDLYDTIKYIIETEHINFKEQCHCFTISEYANWAIKNKENIDYNDHNTLRMIQLYKIFHKDFLLWEYNPTDSNELNKEFYAELLYILGLQDKKDKNAITIQPTKSKGALFTETLHKIQTESHISDTKKQTKETFSLVTTWLNRILFLKLFEGQLVAFNDNKKQYKFMESDKINNFDDLNTLFFDILGTPIDKRREKEKNHIPYLNSSLFEVSDIEKLTSIRISNIPSNNELKLYATSVLHNSPKYKKVSKANTLQYLLDFLDSYDFSAVHNQDIVREKSPEIISSAVLGLIFEKLNGYQDGSYYTPGQITEYMAQQSINKAVIQKFNDTFTDCNCETITDLKNYLGKVYKFDDYQKYVKIIDSLTVCDPAVGSGHFLVSALNQIIALKSELGLLWYKENKILEKAEVLNDTLHISCENEKLFVYKREITNTHNTQKAIFAEKKRIIENCLFAVDINPNSVEICRLRLWIELLKHTYYTDSNNMKILPNIDINVKCGNSLISKFPPKVGTSLFGTSPTEKEKQDIAEFKNLVHKYINANGRQKKQDVQEQLNALKDKITSVLKDNLFQDVTSPEIQKAIEKQKKQVEKVKSDGDWVRLEQEKIKLNKLRSKGSSAVYGDKFKDPMYKDSLEWILEFPEVLNKDAIFVGFDVVIGNPPYIPYKKVSGISFYKNNYKICDNKQTNKPNLYCLFIERSLNLVKKNGILYFINPISFLVQSDSIVLRKILLEKNIFELSDTSYIDVFNGAGTYTVILGLKNNTDIEPITTKKIYNLEHLKLSDMNRKIDKNLFSAPDYLIILSKHLDLLQKIIQKGSRLNNYADVQVGISQTGFSNYITNTPTTGYEKCLIASNIFKYSIDKEYGFIKKNIFSDKKINLFKKDKIITTKMTEKLRCYIDRDRFFCGKVNFIIPKNKFSIEVLVAFLNSNIFTFYYNQTYDALHKQGGAFGFDTPSIEKFPIQPDISQKIQENIIDLVNKCQETKKHNPNASIAEYETKINDIIYSLYNLTDEDIHIIENTL